MNLHFCTTHIHLSHANEKEVNAERLAHYSGCLHSRGKLDSARVLSEVARHEENETKEPMTHPVNTRPLWASSRLRNCPIAKQSQLISLIRTAGALNCVALCKYAVLDYQSVLTVTAIDNRSGEEHIFLKIQQNMTDIPSV